MPLSCAFIGLGLIGGSIAKAIRKYHPDAFIAAYNPGRASLDEAIADGVADCGTDSVLEAGAQDSVFSRCHYVFLCAPVSCNDENLALVKKFLSDDTIITDIGSVKGDIHKAVVRAGLQSHFIGGHPMAGSERTKYRNSHAELLENAYYILAPEPEVPAAEVEAFRDLIASLAAIPLLLDNATHDYAVAAVSHVPHVISASLVNLVKENDTPDGILRMIAAGGFRDITRISSSSPVMWQQICLTNRADILSLLDKYMAKLQESRGIIAASDGQAILDMFESARNYRESFSNLRGGALPQNFSIRVKIADHPGVLADVVSLLAAQDINIRNIGITHSREYEEGVLLLELHTRDGQEKAASVLRENGFEIEVLK